MTSVTTKILAILGVVAVIGIIGISVVSADGVSSTSALSDGQMTAQGNGDCDQTQNMTKDQLCDGSCCECQELAGEGDMQQNQYAGEGDMEQNQNEWSWQYEWAHQHAGEPLV
jgi:hypothetical protein